MRAPRHHPDHGQATVVLLGCVALAAVVAVGAGELGVRLVHRQRAQTAADAAALAGVTGGPAAAARLAGVNGARLVSFTADGDDVLVVVEVDGERAAARATDGP